MTKNHLIAGIVGAALFALVALPALAQTDQNVPTPSGTAPTLTMRGVISSIQWTGCTDDKADCMTIMDLTSSPAPVLVTSKTTSVAANLPVTIIIPAGDSIELANGNTVPATDLRKGDEVVVDYQALDYGNVATSVKFRARNGIGQNF